jgi:tetratricopeptide (TPR) repeat protein
MRQWLAWAVISVLLGLKARGQANKTSELPPDLGLTKVGRQHHAIQTSSWEAQAYFDQGVTLLYGFNHEEAERAFEQAAKLDPASPMALWGIAMAVGPNYNMDVDAEREKLAFETIQKAKKLSKASPPVERDYVDALATRYSGDAAPNYSKLSRDFAAAMKTLSEKYPDDLDAATFYAESLMDLNPWKLWTADGKPAAGTEEIIRVLESVLRRDPMHAGANHYYIHAVEASPDPDRALGSAHRLDTLVPQAGHLVHMPAHIYIRTGDYQAAAKNNEVAAEVDKVYAERAQKEGSLYDLMYHSHNEHFEAAAASMAGRYGQALQASEALSNRLAPHAAMMQMLERFMITPFWVDARFSKWNKILERPEPKRELALTHAFWRYTRTLAWAGTGDAAKAIAERELLKSESANVPDDSKSGPRNVAKVLLDIAGHVADARIAAAESKPEKAIKHWEKAVAIQDAMNYEEPPDWYYPVRESLGGALLAAGKVQESERVFREDLNRNPRNPRSLFGLEASLIAQGKTADAAWVERQFREAWKGADTELKLSEL